MMLHTGTVESKSEFSDRELFLRSLEAIVSKYYSTKKFKIFSKRKSYNPMDQWYTKGGGGPPPLKDQILVKKYFFFGGSKSQRNRLRNPKMSFVT